MDEELQASQPSQNLKKELYGWAQAMMAALVLFVLLFTLVFRVIGVDGSSMAYTLENGERLLCSNLFYEPKNGDIVIFTIKGLRFPGYPDRDMALVKRIIATEGQTLDIDFSSGTVSVDGVLLDEPYAGPTIDSEDLAQQVTLTVPEGKVFVMGDNRTASTDSRDERIGFVDERDILGRVLVRFSPIQKLGPVE